MRRLLVLSALLVALPAGAVDIEWVYVGNPGNPPDPPDPSVDCGLDPFGDPWPVTKCLKDESVCGSVPYVYYISKHEITHAQYAELLNAKAASEDSTTSPFEALLYSGYAAAVIDRGGLPGSYTYAAEPGFENKPVVVTLPQALRFANWLNNGQGSGDTETGAYTLPRDTLENSGITRNEGEKVFLPSESEWHKAAYYDPALPGYYDYPTGTDVPPTCGPPSTEPNTANCLRIPLDFSGEISVFVEGVGSYPSSASPYGTFDQAGNLSEWNETTTSYLFRTSGELKRYYEFGVRGSDFRYAGPAPSSCEGWRSGAPVSPYNLVGFRVVLVPEPAQVLLALTGGLVLAAARQRGA
jgi:formylglycine-generating enzyme required for sulfatase activity